MIFAPVSLNLTTLFFFSLSLSLFPFLFADERSIVQQYLAHPRVVRQMNKEDGDWTEHSYASAFKVFVDMKQDKAESPPSAVIGSSAGHSDALVTPPSYAVLQERMMIFMRAFNVSKTEAYKARVAKRFESSLPSFTRSKLQLRDES